MIGRFRIRGVDVAVDSRHISRVATIDWIHDVPGLPTGILGLVDVDGELIPLVDDAVVLPEAPPSDAPSRRRVAVLLFDGSPFAITVDEVRSLDEALPPDADVVVLEGAGIWQRVADLNGGRR